MQLQSIPQGRAAAIGGFQSSRMPSTGFGARVFGDVREVDVRVRIFIPSPVVGMDLPQLGTVQAFGGDGRSFSYDLGTARADLHARVRLRQQGAPRITIVRRAWGESTQYNTDDVFQVQGKPDWWKDKNAGATPTERDTLTASSSNLDLTIGGTLTSNIEATISDATVITFTADGGIPLARMSPNINADLVIFIQIEAGRLKAKVSGDHDGFPAYEVYVERQRIYEYDPEAAGNSPLSLFPPSDIDVDTGWIDIGPFEVGQELSFGPLGISARGVALDLPGSGMPAGAGGLYAQQYPYGGGVRQIGGLPILSSGGGVPAAQPMRPGSQLAIPGRSFDGGASIAIGIAQLGATAITAITDNSGDISWDLRGLDGYYHPQHDFWTDDVRRQKGTTGWRAPWSFEVFCKMETVAGDEMSARIPISFQGNGTYIANVEVGHPSNLNDAWLWDLHITGVVTRDSQTFARGGFQEAASVKLEFTYHFSSPIHDSKICKLTYSLYANGDVVRSVRWTQP